MTNSTPDPLVGRTVGQYQILARLGGGGMGVVYTARAAKLGRVVALKFLPPQWSHDESARQRFMREAQAASATNHPNICTIHDIETADDGQLFIVMAYYEGETLKKRLESGALPIDEALDIATQVADGLAKAHAQGVVHRDIKPGNLILTEDGARILDFGLATFADALKLTAENAPLGTIAYMSPEQVRGLEADARSDVWALGCVLYEMLTGHAPFRGSHSEAIAFAIRNEAPLPIRAQRPDVPEEVEQLVFRALHKEASVRYPSGRELARALRQVRGLSVPMELRTQSLSVPRAAAPPSPRWRVWASVAGVLSLGAVAVGVLVFWPVERTPVAIVPVVNLTGYRELDPLRLGLTYALNSALADSKTVRVLGHQQESSILRRFRVEGKDITSGEVLRAITANTGARTLVVVTILNEGHGFKARAEFRNAETATTEAAYETDPEANTLVKQAAYHLIPVLVAGIEEHFRTRASGRAYLVGVVRRMLHQDRPIVLPARTLEAAVLLEEGLDRYEEQEYRSALDSFNAAAKQDPLNPLMVAWRSRVSRVMRRDVEAEQLAREALALLSAETPARDRLFVEAVAAESRQDVMTATERYLALTDMYPDTPAFLMELAGFQDRQIRNLEAITTYRRALALDARLVRVHVELCRVFNRINQPTDARDEGRQAVNGYAALGADAGRAQALMCLTDSLRLGDDQAQAEAVGHAQAAVKVFESLKYEYNLARAYNYVALAMEAQGRLDEAATLWERSLAATEAVGNVVLQPLVLMNLGYMNTSLGNRPAAIDFFQRGLGGFETLGDRARAAENQFNIGTLYVSYGKPQEGLRLVQDALEVFRQLKNRRFEILASLAISTHYLQAGNSAEAERELNRARSSANERDLNRERVPISIRLAQTHLSTGDYEAARQLLVEVLPSAKGREKLRTQIYLARVHLRLGDFAASQTLLQQVSAAFQKGRDAALRPLLDVTRGELEYETGRIEGARAYFADGAAFVTNDLPDDTALESLAYIGLLEARASHYDRARAIIRKSLDVAQQIGHVSLEARCRVFLAQLEIARGNFEQALRDLAAVPPDGDSRMIERELRAQVLYWSSRGRAGQRDVGGASQDADAARKVLLHIASSLPDVRRASFLARPTIGLILK